MWNVVHSVIVLVRSFKEITKSMLYYILDTAPGPAVVWMRPCWIQKPKWVTCDKKIRFVAKITRKLYYKYGLSGPIGRSLVRTFPTFCLPQTHFVKKCGEYIPPAPGAPHLAITIITITAEVVHKIEPRSSPNCIKVLQIEHINYRLVTGGRCIEAKAKPLRVQGHDFGSSTSM